MQEVIPTGNPAHCRIYLSAAPNFGFVGFVSNADSSQERTPHSCFTHVTWEWSALMGARTGGYSRQGVVNASGKDW